MQAHCSLPWLAAVISLLMGVDLLEGQPAKAEGPLRGLLREDQHQLISQGLQRPRLQGQQFGNLAYQQADFRFKRRNMQRAYECMAASCHSKLQMCSLTEPCIAALVEDMIDGNCSSSSVTDKQGAENHQRLLACYRRHCSPPQLYATRKAVLSPEEVAKVLSLKEAALAEAKTAGLARMDVQSFRNFGRYDSDELAVGHTVSFVHRVIKRDLPDLLARLKASALEADSEMAWGVGAHGYSAAYLKLRSAEIVDYMSTQGGATRAEKPHAKKWIEISADRGCFLNHDAARKESEGQALEEQIRILGHGEGVENITRCQTKCVETQGCQAIDWQASLKSCILFNLPCEYPVGKGAASYRLGFEGSQIGSHTDSGSLLSVSVHLQDPNDYIGGQLSFRSDCANESQAEVTRAGDVVIWPSWIGHKLSPVTQGRLDDRVS
eukprot:TRINITY_DN29283_c0_g1_i2.p1 TRINITY_DN29283_c0_g1~~TRINITY_DN29283_c0_g1_i2.p1  ORF type:complete len:437 (+),score=81.01 TRINITY_DN29283_c0_g1_i2:52-1362(+)